MGRPITLAEVRQLPVVMSPTAAGRALGLGSTTVGELVRAGRFPVPLRTQGRRQVVVIGDLLEFLGIHTKGASHEHEGEPRG